MPLLPIINRRSSIVNLDAPGHPRPSTLNPQPSTSAAGHGPGHHADSALGDAHHGRRVSGHQPPRTQRRHHHHRHRQRPAGRRRRARQCRGANRRQHLRHHQRRRLQLRPARLHQLHQRSWVFVNRSSVKLHQSYQRQLSIIRAVPPSPATTSSKTWPICFISRARRSI